MTQPVPSPLNEDNPADTVPTGAASEAAALSWRNPDPGSVLTVVAGERAEVLFDLVNHAPFVAEFHVEVEGLPAADWAEGTGEGAGTRVAAHGGGTLRLILTPPADAPSGHHDFQVREISEGQLIRETPLLLSIPATDAAPGFDAADAHSTPFDTALPQPNAIPDSAQSIAAQSTAAQSAAERESLPLVELKRPVIAQTEDEEESGYAEPDEPSVLDPEDGTVFTLRPGETLLVRFSFLNDSPHARTYVLDEDRSLPVGWLTMVQDEVNITRDESDELSVRLAPPLNARPGRYSFGTRVGLEDGELLPHRFILQIQAVPAVRLQAKQRALRIGPFRRIVRFALSVESVGNTDTAFRVVAHAPTSAANRASRAKDEGAMSGHQAVYETPRWRHLFDRELDNLRSLTPNRPPKARPIELRVERRGIWWWGIRESHRLRVTAAPVTDSANGGKADNSVDLAVTRWRPYPLPLRILAPLILLPLLLLLGTAGNLAVENATLRGEDGTYYIVSQPKGTRNVSAKLSWDAPIFSLLRLQSVGENFASEPYFVQSPTASSVHFAFGQRSINRVYQVNRLVGGNGPSTKVVFIAARPDTPLIVANSNMVLRGKTLSLLIPLNGEVILKLSNAAFQDYALNYWVAHRPGSAFYINDLNDEGSIKPFIKYGPNSGLVFRITRGPAAIGGEEDELVLVTTDLYRPVLRLRLNLAPNPALLPGLAPRPGSVQALNLTSRSGADGKRSSMGGVYAR